MRLKFLKDHTAVVDKLTSQTWPKGWEGEVDDVVGAKILANAGAAERLADVLPPVSFTEREASVLKTAAQSALAMAEAEQPTATEERPPAEPVRPAKGGKARKGGR